MNLGGFYRCPINAHAPMGVKRVDVALLKAVIKGATGKGNSMITQEEIRNIIRKIESLDIRVYEGGGEVWYDAYRNFSPEERIILGLFSRKIKEHQAEFVEFLWKRDYNDSANKAVGKEIIRKL